MGGRRGKPKSSVWLESLSWCIMALKYGWAEAEPYVIWVCGRWDRRSIVGSCTCIISTLQKPLGSTSPSPKNSSQSLAVAKSNRLSEWYQPAMMFFCFFCVRYSTWVLGSLGLHCHSVLHSMDCWRCLSISRPAFQLYGVSWAWRPRYQCSIAKINKFGVHRIQLTSKELNLTPQEKSTKLIGTEMGFSRRWDRQGHPACQVGGWRVTQIKWQITSQSSFRKEQSKNFCGNIAFFLFCLQAQVTRYVVTCCSCCRCCYCWSIKRLIDWSLASRRHTLS